MFVLLNKNLNRYFKYKNDIWWTKDLKEAEDVLSAIKDCVNEMMPELNNGLEIVDIDDLASIH